jgi:hypothetical protein
MIRDIVYTFFAQFHGLWQHISEDIFPTILPQLHINEDEQDGQRRR